MGVRWRFPRVIAHRGGGRLAPENTLAAMHCALEQGYRAVEFDVKLSGDNHAFLLHDDLLDRTTNGRGAAALQPWRALAALDAGSWFAPHFAGERLPQLEDIARLCVQERLCANVEIKPCPERGVETGTMVAEQVDRLWTGARDTVLLSSFSLEALAAAQKQAPHLARGVLFEALPGNWREIARGLDCVSVHVDVERLSEAQAAAVLAAGYRLLAYTVNDAATAERLFGWGVHAVFTDALPELKALQSAAA